MFRENKQHIGTGDAQSGWEKGTGTRLERREERERLKGRGHAGGNAVERTVPFMFCLHAVVVLFGLMSSSSDEPKHFRWRPSWRRREATPSFADLLYHARAELDGPTISSHPRRSRVAWNREPPLQLLLLAA